MLKFTIDNVQENTSIIGFGFEEANLKMLQESRPIYIAASDLKCKALTSNVLITYARSQHQISKQLNMLMGALKASPPAAATLRRDGKTIQRTPPNTLPVNNISDMFHVTVLIPTQGPPLLVIILGPHSYGMLRKGQALGYRTRIYKNGVEDGTPDATFEIKMFWGNTEADLMSQLTPLAPQVEKQSEKPADTPGLRKALWHWNERN